MSRSFSWKGIGKPSGRFLVGKGVARKIIFPSGTYFPGSPLRILILLECHSWCRQKKRRDGDVWLGALFGGFLFLQFSFDLQSCYDFFLFVLIFLFFFRGTGPYICNSGSALGVNQLKLLTA